MEERAKFWRDPAFGGVDLLSARFATHRFARHAHDEFVIAVFEQGAERFEAGGATHAAAAGSVLIIPPGMYHTGSAATSAGWTYRAFYPPWRMFTKLRARVFETGGSLAPPPLQQLRDRELHSVLIAAHRACETGAPRLERESRMLDAFARLLNRLERLDLAPPGRESLAVRRVIEYMEEHFTDDVGINELAGIAQLSASYLMRSFQRQLGISMHVYLTKIRLRHVREMLVGGEPAAQVAHAVGFVDQSHLIRRFKHSYGATPGSYVRNTKLHDGL